jgi:hypothetical protein
METTQKLMPLLATSRATGIKADNLRIEAEAGTLPSVRVGDELMFSIPDVESALLRRQHAPRSLTSLSIHLNIPAAFLRRLALAGDIPCVQLGRIMLFDVAAVEKALAELAATSTAADSPTNNMPANVGGAK